MKQKMEIKDIISITLLSLIHGLLLINFVNFGLNFVNSMVRLDDFFNLNK